MQAFVLAGGLGTRLRPYTYKIPKPMFPVNNKPFLYYLLIYLKEQGIKDFILSIGYLGDKIKDYFKEGKDLGIKIIYSEEKEPMGTGGALKLAENYLDEKFFIIYGDSFLPENYKEIYKSFVKSNKLLLIVGYSNKQETGAKNNLRVDTNLIIREYKKNPPDPEKYNFVDAGVLVASKKIVKFIPAGKKISLEEEIFPVIVQQEQAVCYPTQNYFYDIGTIERVKNFERYVNDYFKNTI